MVDRFVAVSLVESYASMLLLEHMFKSWLFLVLLFSMIIVIPDLTAARTLQVNEILKCNRPCNQFLGSYCYITIKLTWKSDKYLDRNFQEKDKVAFFSAWRRRSLHRLDQVGTESTQHMAGKNKKEINLNEYKMKC